MSTGPKKVDKSTKTVVVKAADGTEHALKVADQATIHGTKEGFDGLKEVGCGNYVSAWGSLGFTIRHVSVNAGYQLGSRLVVNRDTSTNRIGVDLTEKGPAAGMEFSF